MLNIKEYESTFYLNFPSPVFQKSQNVSNESYKGSLQTQCGGQKEKKKIR